MSTTMVNQTAQQSSFSVHLSPQATQDEIDLNPVFSEVHLRTAGLLNATPTFEQSGAITTDGQPSDNIKTGEDLALELAAELNQQSKVLLEAGMEDAFVDNGSAPLATIATTATDLVDSGVAAFTDVEVGDFVFVSGFADPNNDATYYVSAKADNGTITVNPSPASVEAEGATVTVASQKSSFGKAPCLYTYQNRVADASQGGGIAYKTMYNGFTNTYGISIPEQGIITNTVNLVFEKLNAGLAAIAGQSDAPLQTGQVATTPLRKVWEDGVLSTTCFLKSMDLTIEHGYTGNSVAQCSQKRQAKSTPTISGTINRVTFLDNTYQNEQKVQNEITENIAVEIDLKDGFSMVIVIPRMKYTGHSFDGDTAISDALPFSAEKDKDLGTALLVYTNF